MPVCRKGWQKRTTARIELISTQRLLQRSMTIPSQATYMTFVCLAEKLDQFMLLNKTRYSAANEITMADFHLFGSQILSSCYM